MKLLRIRVAIDNVTKHGMTVLDRAVKLPVAFHSYLGNHYSASLGETFDLRVDGEKPIELHLKSVIDDVTMKELYRYFTTYRWLDGFDFVDRRMSANGTGPSF